MVWTYTKTNWLVRDGEEDDNDDPDIATLITVGAAPQHHHFYPSSDVDWFKFEAAEGETYVIETFNALPSYPDNFSSSMDPYIYLHDAGVRVDEESSLLYYDDDSGEGWNSKIVFSCETSGTYYILVKHFNQATGVTGEYDISVVETVGF